MVLNIPVVVILKIGGNLPTILQILFSIPLAKKMKVLCYFMACFSCRESEHASLHPDQSTLNEWARYNFNNIYSNHIPCTWGHSHWVMSYENKPWPNSSKQDHWPNTFMLTKQVLFACISAYLFKTFLSMCYWCCHCYHLSSFPLAYHSVYPPPSVQNVALRLNLTLNLHPLVLNFLTLGKTDCGNPYYLPPSWFYISVASSFNLKFI